ncbi:MAG TPA: hypothetical protein VHP37_21405 [Burkholderiales bacterium]|nr:hypothetical protein [Burkholderiales bacterium]
MDHWHFDGGAESREWSWMCMSEEEGIATQCSARTFPTLTECLQDAVNHGYAD